MVEKERHTENGTVVPKREAGEETPGQSCMVAFPGNALVERLWMHRVRRGSAGKRVSEISTDLVYAGSSPVERIVTAGIRSFSHRIPGHIGRQAPTLVASSICGLLLMTLASGCNTDFERVDISGRNNADGMQTMDLVTTMDSTPVDMTDLVMPTDTSMDGVMPTDMTMDTSMDVADLPSDLMMEMTPDLGPDTADDTDMDEMSDIDLDIDMDTGPKATRCELACEKLRDCIDDSNRCTNTLDVAECATRCEAEEFRHYELEQGLCGDLVRAFVDREACVDPNSTLTCLCEEPAEGSNVGIACDNKTNCVSGTLNAYCVAAGTTPNYPGGYCFAVECATDASCGAGNFCLDTAPGSSPPSACFGGCNGTGDDACREGYTCNHLRFGVSICLPTCSEDSDCVISASCDASTGICG